MCQTASALVPACDEHGTKQTLWGVIGKPYLPRLGKSSPFQETLRGSGRDELLTPNEVVRNCELLVIGLKLFLGKIDHDDLRVFA
jgi:hypothetical protein